MRKRICSLALCFCLLLSLPVFLGAGAQPEEDSGLVLSKSSEYDAGTGAVRITLEAYASGQIITQRVSMPCDIVLVLDESGSMASLFAGSGKTRRAALVSAVNAFLAQMEMENSKLSPDVTPHRVGMIGFSTENGARIIRDLSTDLTAIEERTLNTSGGTYINKGLALADGLFQAGEAAVAGEQRSRVVIAFTDDDPGTGSWASGSTKQCAADAIQIAASLKTGGVTVYTVGIFSGADPADLTGEANQFMNAMSSNYPSATAAYANYQYSVALGARGEGNYYLSASNTEALESIFKEIASQTGGAAVTLDSSAVVLDEISDAFAFPEGADAGSIAVTTQDADYSTGALHWTETTLTDFDPTVTVENNTVRVTGFDFNRNFVAEQGRVEGNVAQSGTFHGRKLIISFEVLPKDGLIGGDVATNGPASGVYDADGNCVESFEVPTVYVPLQPVAPVAVNPALYLGETLDLRTLLSDPDAGLDGVNNTADLTYAICDGAQTVGTYTVRAGETSGTWAWAADYTADHFQNGMITPEYARKTYTVICTASSGGQTATASAAATVAVKTCSLTIQKTGWDARDEGQSFLFRVRGEGNGCAEAISLQVAVQENGSVTITDLPVGTYCIEEDASWSWRYAPAAPAEAVLTGTSGQDSATVTVSSSRTAGSWLSGSSFAVRAAD